MMDTDFIIAFCVLCLVYPSCCDTASHVIDFGGPPRDYDIPSISGGPYISHVKDLYGGVHHSRIIPVDSTLLVVKTSPKQEVISYKIMAALAGDAYRAHHKATMIGGVRVDIQSPKRKVPARKYILKQVRHSKILESKTMIKNDISQVQTSSNFAIPAGRLESKAMIKNDTSQGQTSSNFAIPAGRNNGQLENITILKTSMTTASNVINRLKPPINRSESIFDIVGDKFDATDRNVLKVPESIFRNKEPIELDFVGKLIDELSCGNTNVTFIDKTLCLNSSQSKTNDTLYLREKYTNETNADMAANTQSAPVNEKQVYGYQPFLEPAYQYIYPIFLGTCLGTTFMLVLVLIKQFQTATAMSRASISILLAIAVSDALTTGFGLSEISYRFSETTGNPGFLPYSSCNTMFIIGHLSGVVHEASVWLTVILTAQRYICVSRPFFARRRINLRMSLISITIVFVVTLSFHIFRFFDRYFVKVFVEQSNTLAEESFETCDLLYASWIKDPANYESIFIWLVIALMQLLPCMIITIFVALIEKVLIKKKTGLVVAKTAKSQRAQITVIIVVIAMIAVSVELSSGIFLSLCVWGTSTGNFLFSFETMKSVAVVFDLVLYVSYFVIFLIYCLMSQEVRKAIIAFCTAVCL